MNRNEFLLKTVFSALGVGIGTQAVSEKKPNRNGTGDQVGFNHI